LLALLASPPKDCKDDGACIQEAAKTCAPAMYLWKGKQDMMGVSGTGSTTVIIHGTRSGRCQVEFQDVVETAQISDEMMNLIMPDAGTAERQERVKQMIADAAKDPSAHMNCSLEQKGAAEFVRKRLPTTKDVKYDSNTDPFADCTPTNCGPKPHVAAGCAVTVCGPGGWHFTCGKPKVECAQGMSETYNEACTLTCIAAPKGPPKVSVECR
jgi:hypothetical protein